MRLNVRDAQIEKFDGSGAAPHGQPLPEFVLEIVAQNRLLPKLAADGYIPTNPAKA